MDYKLNSILFEHQQPHLKYLGYQDYCRVTLEMLSELCMANQLHTINPHKCNLLAYLANVNTQIDFKHQAY